MQSKLRREDRQTAPASVRVMWQDASGAEKFAMVHSYDISPAGMRLELPERVEPRSLVGLHCKALGLQGTASVRNCISRGSRYLVGLEFLGGLKWTPREPRALEG